MRGGDLFHSSEFLLSSLPRRNKNAQSARQWHMQCICNSLSSEQDASKLGDTAMPGGRSTLKHTT